MATDTRTWRVWATRPEQQNAAWMELLRAQGFQVAEAPLLAIEPVSDPQMVQSVRELILNLDQFQKVIFVSQNAVETAFNWLEDYWPQLPVGIEWLAVGKATAAKVAARGLSVKAAENAMDSDELLALPSMQSVWGQKILICRGVGGLPRMGEVLHQRGAMVRFCELYERRLPETATQDVQLALSGGQARSLVPLFSGQTLQNFAQVLDKLRISASQLPLVVPGRRVGDLAQAQGFSDVTIAANASEAFMLEALLNRVQSQA